MKCCMLVGSEACREREKSLGCQVKPLDILNFAFEDIGACFNMQSCNLGLETFYCYGNKN